MSDPLEQAYETGYTDGENSLEADFATMLDDLGIEVGDGPVIAEIRALLDRHLPGARASYQRLPRGSNVTRFVTRKKHRWSGWRW